MLTRMANGTVLAHFDDDDWWLPPSPSPSSFSSPSPCKCWCSCALRLANPDQSLSSPSPSPSPSPSTALPRYPTSTCPRRPSQSPPAASPVSAASCCAGTCANRTRHHSVGSPASALDRVRRLDWIRLDTDELDHLHPRRRRRRRTGRKASGQ